MDEGQRRRGQQCRFRITEHTLSFAPPTAVVESTLRINIEDWQNSSESDPGGIKGVAAVRIAGEEAFLTGAIEHEISGEPCVEYTRRHLADDDRLLSFVVRVPKGILEGEQTVSLYDYDQLELRKGTEQFASISDTNGMNFEPCKEEPEEIGEEFDVRLKSDAIPLIQSTVEIIGERREAPQAENVIEVDGGRDVGREEGMVLPGQRAEGHEILRQRQRQHCYQVRQVL